jgi:hypothetical protein
MSTPILANAQDPSATESPLLHARTAKTRLSDEPNYGVMWFGAGIFSIGALLQVADHSFGVTPTPIFQAAALGIGMALILYGVNPRLGTGTKYAWAHLSLVGPTAAGAAIAWFSYSAIMEARVIENTVVLYNDPASNTRSFEDGASIRLINVDSLKPKNLTSVLDSVAKDLGTIDGMLIATSLPLVMEAVMQNVGVRWTEVEPLIIRYLHSPEGGINNDWESLVNRTAALRGQEGSAGHDAFMTRLRSQPFAIVEITEQGTAKPRVIIPGPDVSIGTRKFSVPIVANPQRENSELKEGIVLIPR